MSYRIFVLSTTHWDREWYMPHEKYLVRLVSLFDRLLDLMEEKKEYVFITDGQFSMVDDYLKARPENTERLKALVAEGRLKVGPWYTQPLQTLVSGEAIIRNLHYGIKESEKLGGAMKFSYEIDEFGHASQIPQILRGFGIEAAMGWRGIPKGAKSAFKWVSPDGSAITMLYSNRGYGEATDLPLSREDSVCVVDGVERRRDGLDKRIERLHALRDAYSETDVRLWLNGIDHSFAQPDILEVIEKINAEFPEYTVKQATPEEYLEAIRAAYAAAGIDMQEIRGELMSSHEQMLESIHSAHPRQKLAHFDTENLLESGVEPTAALAWLAGFDAHEWAQERAWKYVLENHAHDTLGCCSVDDVFNEAMTRYRCARALSEQVCEDSRRDIMSCFTDFPSMFVFNTTAHDFEGVAEFTLDIPKGICTESFSLESADGTAIPMQIIGARPITDVRYNPRWGHPLISGGVQVRVLCSLPKVEPFGWLRLNIKEGAPRVKRNRTVHYLSKEPCVMENEFLRVKINRDGSFDLTDKLTGVTYPDQYSWEDTGDIDNIYVHVPQRFGKTVYSKGAVAEISLIYDNPLACSYEIRLDLAIPEGDGIYEQRSERNVNCSIKLTLTLANGVKHLEVVAEIENRAREHRLRALFPTYITDTEVSRGGQPFDVVEKPIYESASQDGLAEQAYATHPMQKICDVTGKTHGLMLAARGIYEYECIDDDSRALALTMLRCHNKIFGFFGTTGQYELKEAENLTVVTFRTALIPHGADSREAYECAMRFITPPVMTLSRAPERSLLADYVSPKIKLPDSASAIRLEQDGKLTVTALKKAFDRNSLIVRVLNIGDRETDGKLSLTFPNLAPKNIYETDLNENRIRRVGSESASFTLRARGLITFEFEI